MIQQYRDAFLRQAQETAARPYTAYGGQTVAGIDPRSLQAASIFGGGAELARLGVGALSGDPAARAAFMNPYQQDVLNAVASQYADLRNRATLATNDAATQARAFGGSRHGVALGQALGDLLRAEGETRAGLLQSGFNDAMQRAATAANLGFGAAGQLGAFGDYFRNVEQQRLSDAYSRWREMQDYPLQQLSILQGALAGMPMGGSVTQTTPGSGMLGGAIGGALAGLGLQNMLGGGGGGLGFGAAPGPAGLLGQTPFYNQRPGTYYYG